ncbi:hypothetical protein, partial [Rickettsia amblyommatis]|uniref:Uncharacterized protein n=2 Tax=Rickettsia amblyommatis TaxID=33989 RepID=H8K344_RICAG
MEFNRKNAIIGFLKAHEDQKFTSYGIAEWCVENHIDEARLKANASTNKRLLEAKIQEEKDKEIIGIDSGDISSSKLSAERRQEPNIRIELKPKLKFYYSQNPGYYVNNEQATEPKINANKEDKITAVQVCDALALYLQNKLKIHNMPIKHHLSSNKQGTKGNNKWLHPDWVGMEVLNEKWSSLIKDCAKYYAGKQARF